MSTENPNRQAWVNWLKEELVCPHLVEEVSKGILEACGPLHNNFRSDLMSLLWSKTGYGDALAVCHNSSLPTWEPLHKAAFEHGKLTIFNVLYPDRSVKLIRTDPITAPVYFDDKKILTVTEAEFKNSPYYNGKSTDSSEFRPHWCKYSPHRYEFVTRKNSLYEYSAVLCKANINFLGEFKVFSFPQVSNANCGETASLDELNSLNPKIQFESIYHREPKTKPVPTTWKWMYYSVDKTLLYTDGVQWTGKLPAALNNLSYFTYFGTDTTPILVGDESLVDLSPAQKQFLTETFGIEPTDQLLEKQIRQRVDLLKRFQDITLPRWMQLQNGEERSFVLVKALHPQHVEYVGANNDSILRKLEAPFKLDFKHCTLEAVNDYLRTMGLFTPSLSDYARPGFVASSESLNETQRDEYSGYRWMWWGADSSFVFTNKEEFTGLISYPYRSHCISGTKSVKGICGGMEPRELTPTETGYLKEVYNLGLTDHITKEEIVERFTAYQRRTSKPKPKNVVKPRETVVKCWMLYNNEVPEFVLTMDSDGGYTYNSVHNSDKVHHHPTTQSLKNCTLERLNQVLETRGLVAFSLESVELYPITTLSSTPSDFADESLSPGAGIGYISSQAALDPTETYQPQMPSEELGIPIRKKNSSTRLSL